MNLNGNPLQNVMADLFAGIQSEGLREIAGEVLKLFIMNGRPWSGNCTDDEYIDSRFMFLQFLTNFAVQHWKVST